MHKDEHPEYKYRPRRRPKGIKRGYTSPNAFEAPTMMVSPVAAAVGKPYTVSTSWARILHQPDGDINVPRAEAPTIVYGSDGTQYYAISKGTTFPHQLLSQAQTGSVIVSPTHIQQQHGVATGSIASSSTNSYPSYVTVPLPATSTAIFHPVAIPVQGMHTPAFVLRPPYNSSSIYAPTVLNSPTSTTAASVAYHPVEQRTTEVQAPTQQLASKAESTNTIVKTPDGETIVIIQRPLDGSIPLQVRDGTLTVASTNTLSVVAHPQYITSSPVAGQQLYHLQPYHFQQVQQQHIQQHQLPGQSQSLQRHQATVQSSQRNQIIVNQAVSIEEADQQIRSMYVQESDIHPQEVILRQHEKQDNVENSSSIPASHCKLELVTQEATS